MVLYCDKMSAINITKNLVQHNCTKHIDIHHHFIRDLVETNVISLERVCNFVQLVDILTKLLKVTVFENFYVGLGVCQFSW